MRKLLVSFILLLVSWGCAETVAFNEVCTVSRNGVAVSLRFLPTDFFYAEAYHATRTAEKHLYDRSLYFQLRIGFEDQTRDIVYDPSHTRQGAYGDWLQRLLFGLREYVYLETASGEIIPLDLYHMERSFGLSKDRIFLLVFPKPFENPQEERELTLHIREFGLGTGAMRFMVKLPDARLAKV